MSNPAGPLDSTGYSDTLLRAGVDVSRETLSRLGLFLSLLEKWQRTINLVSASTLQDPWRRHLLDSGQLLPLLPPGAKAAIDLGSGGGLPGLVVAAHRPEMAITLVEADGRKAAFLMEAARQMQLPNVKVRIARIETLGPMPHPVVTARALAPLVRLLEWAEPCRAADSVSLFHKGARFEEELTDARRDWKIQADVIPSLADPSGVIVRIVSAERMQR